MTDRFIISYRRIAVNNLAWIGNPYYFLLSLLILSYASYTMIKIVDQASYREQAKVDTTLLGAAIIFSLGLWTKYAVGLLASDDMLVVNWGMIFIFCLTIMAVYGALVLHVRQLLPPRLTDLAVSAVMAAAAMVLHYLSFFTHSFVHFTVSFIPLILSFVVFFLASCLTFRLLRCKPRYYAAIGACLLGAGGMMMHQLGLNAMIIQYRDILTIDRLNDYLMLLAIILWMATFLITSFSLTNWSTQRKYAAMDERYKLLVENSLDTIVLIKDGCWEYINPSGLGLFQASHEKQLLGTSIFHLLQKPYHNEMAEWLGGIRAGEDLPSSTVEVQWMTMEGKLVLTEVVRTRTKLDGVPIMQAIIRDISERKRNEELFVNAEKLSIAGQLAAGIAHEIRNPLTSLKGFIQLMASGRVPTERYFDIMKSELSLIETTISELLMLSKPQVNDFVVLDLRDLLRDTVQFLKNQALHSGVRLELEAAPMAMWVKGVESQLRQVFINVLKNGIESMQNGGTVTIGFLQEGAEEYHIVIRDEGVGMPEDQLAKIGQPFYTTKDKGTGLGLMVTYKIIDNHQGRISAESETGEGTTFRIALPRHRVFQPRLVEN